MILKETAGKTPSFPEESVSEGVVIPDNVQNNELKNKILTFFKKIGSKVSPRDIEICHRLDSDKVIVKFSRCKDYEKIMFVKKDLKHLTKCRRLGYQVIVRFL